MHETTPSNVLDTAPAALARLSEWVGEVAGLTRPDSIHWVDGSDAEYRMLTDGLVAAGTLVRLDGDAAAPTGVSSGPDSGTTPAS
ncbi:GTP-dependent phosphoenolpyruvate carboxykinase [Arthrobacter sp. UYEF20]